MRILLAEDIDVLKEFVIKEKIVVISVNNAANMDVADKRTNLTKLNNLGLFSKPALQKTQGLLDKLVYFLVFLMIVLLLF